MPNGEMNGGRRRALVAMDASVFRMCVIDAKKRLYARLQNRMSAVRMISDRLDGAADRHSTV